MSNIDNNNEQLSFNDLSTRELKSIIGILKTTTTFEEFLIQLDLLGYSDLQKQDIFLSLALEGQNKIQTILKSRRYDRTSYIMDSELTSINSNSINNVIQWTTNEYSTKST